jgi:hypothetical protein
MFAPTYGYLPALVADLKSARGSSVTNILFCIGSAGPNDSKTINMLLDAPEGRQTLCRNFDALSANLSIEG